jgi:hypothetical protein
LEIQYKKEEIKSAYKEYIESKTLNLREKLDLAGCGNLFQRIESSAIEEGFRNRAKFKVFSNKEKCRI